MLDTNTLDYIYTNQRLLVPKLKKYSKYHTNLYITHIQQNEINKIKDITKIDCINKIISIIGIKRIITSTIMDIDEPSKYEFNDSNIGLYEIVDDSDDSHILRILQRNTCVNPIGNLADLLILYTAVKKKMNYLITDNISDFEPMLKELSKFKPNYLQLKRNHNFFFTCKSKSLN
ncbi:MAG TPA: hypothetical protein VJ697_13620 [Nitrososphaeraceae archaeon]|nr:hypothetical protein [Nitrososphaeraceae archaeon]